MGLNAKVGNMLETVCQWNVEAPTAYWIGSHVEEGFGTGFAQQDTKGTRLS